MTALFGYGAMALLGVVLGLIGAGGSILVVPILVYLFGVPAAQATGYSLVIVGTTALAGAVTYLRRGQSDPRMAALFGIPAIAAVYLTRRVLFPAIPDPVLQTSGFSLSKDTAVMVVFAAFMLLAAISMIRPDPATSPDPGRDRPSAAAAALSRPSVLAALGFFVGIFTGLVGAGGGFMILPVLVLAAGLPIRVAIGTDLLIIAAKSLIGFVGEAQAAEAIDWGFVATILALPLIGIAIGTRLNRLVPAERLKSAFGIFVLVMAIYIVGRELVFA